MPSTPPPMPTLPIIDAGEPPHDRTRRRLTVYAHRVLAELIADLVAADVQPITVTTADRRSGLRVVLRLVRYDGPTYEPATPPPDLPLREVEQAALRAAPGPTERPATVRALARRAGYRDTGHWREAVRQLVDRGLLVRVRGGVRRR